jgi:hypothetical protein
MAATFLSTSNAGFVGTTTAPSWSHTIGSGSNLVAIISCAWASAASQTLNTVTYGGQSCTRVPSSLTTDASSVGHTEQFYLIAPSGNQTVTCTFSAAVDSVCGINVYQDAHQTVPIGTAATNTGTGTTAITVTVTSASDEISDAVASINCSANQTFSSTDSGVERWRVNTGGGSNAMDGADSTIAGSASAVHNWTASAACQ